MAPPFLLSRWLPILAAGLVCAGCAELASRRTASVRQAPTPVTTPAGQPFTGGPTPPAPVASLQIPDLPAPQANRVRPAGASESQATPASLKSTDPPAPQRLIPVAQGQALPSRSDTAMPLRNLYRQAQQRYARVDGYIVRLRRREQVGGKQGNEEIILLKFRKDPWSVYLRWLGAEGKNREQIYVKGRYGNQIHTLPAATDTALAGFGVSKHVPLAPDHPLIQGRSRYPITETGVGAMIDRYGRILESFERGTNRFGTLKYLSLIRRPEFDTPVETVLQQIPPGVEPGLPRGGQRFWFFDATNLRFPVLTVALDERGNEVEYYCYDNFLFPASFRDDEFDPDRLFTH